MGCGSGAVVYDPGGNSGGKVYYGDYKSINKFIEPDDLLHVDFDFNKVYFNYNDSEICESELCKLFNNSYELNKCLNAKIIIEGHTDERGTEEYNLELGRLRAESVKQYYITLGIPIENIEIISYGEENPVKFESNEASWLKNRRVETKVRKNNVGY